MVAEVVAPQPPPLVHHARQQVGLSQLHGEAHALLEDVPLQSRHQLATRAEEQRYETGFLLQGRGRGALDIVQLTSAARSHSRRGSRGAPRREGT